jgi:hypothetical protein
LLLNDTQNLMESLHNLETSVLVDLLASKMEEYYHLSKNGIHSVKTDACYLAVKEIQDEIDARKREKRFGHSREQEPASGEN